MPRRSRDSRQLRVSWRARNDPAPNASATTTPPIDEGGCLTKAEVPNDPTISRQSVPGTARERRRHRLGAPDPAAGRGPGTDGSAAGDFHRPSLRRPQHFFNRRAAIGLGGHSMTEKKTRSREGWTRVRFGDVVTNVNDQPKRASLPLATRYVAGEHVDENRLRIDRWGTLGDELVPPTFRRRFGPSDVLFHSRNLKKIAVPDFGGITGEKLFVLRSISPHLLQDFLPYVLLSPAFTTYAESSWSGSVNKFLNWTPLAKYEFDLPPVEEQRSVLVLLNHCADLESELDRLAKSAADLRDSLRSTIAGSTKGRRKLNELASFVTSGSRGWSQYYADDGHVFLRIANLNGPTLAPSTAQRCTARNYWRSRRWTRGNRSGSRTTDICQPACGDDSSQ